MIGTNKKIVGSPLHGLPRGSREAYKGKAIISFVWRKPSSLAACVSIRATTNRGLLGKPIVGFGCKSVSAFEKKILV